MMGIVNAYEPPTIDGSRVPNKVCASVFNPERKSCVCIT